MCWLRHFFALSALTLALGGCALFGPPPDKLTVTRTDFVSIEGWEQDEHAKALAAFAKNCEKILQMSPAKINGKGILSAPVSQWQLPCRIASEMELATDAEARQFFQEFFTPYIAANRGKEEGLFTGYFEPELRGSKLKTGRYRYPLYRLPPGLKDGQQIFSRAEIEAGALAGRQLELIWVDDPVALFFLQIQGSGRVHLEDGRVVRVGYAGKNGHPYVALGKVVNDLGIIPKDEINYFTLRQWLSDHPEEAPGLMNQNPSYVFFRIIDGDGPIGGSGVALTPLRSLAIDTRFIPYATPVFLQTSLPETQFSPAIPFYQLMIAQDTGGAIKGPVRGDVFFGAGMQAEAWAGMMKQRGRYVLLLPRGINPPLQ